MAGEDAGPPSDPRGKNSRPTPLSLLFLAYHWIGFWIGYLRYVLPARIKNRAVIGDRYSYDFLLDPKRLRLQLPKWLLKVASMTVPKPDMALGLLADPGKIVARKNELSKSEIEAYQANLMKLCHGAKHIHRLNADGSIEENVRTARSHILKHL
jgi:thymidylate kinase